MDTSRLYEKCTITRKAMTVENGEETITESAVFSSIPCYVRPISSDGYTSTTEQGEKQRAYITIDRGQEVLVGDIVTVGSVRYRIDEVKKYGLISGANTRLRAFRI